MSRVPAGLWQNLIAVQIYGANTGVGKTVVSTLLGRHFSQREGTTRWNTHYIKPVSTGPSDEADERYVGRYANLPVTTLFKYSDPVSPHIAARNSNSFVPNDDFLLHRLYAKLQNDARSCAMSRGVMGITFVETAGGVLSPGPSKTPQADLFRPMRLPVVLVGDHRLGGIASTISAAESLLLRGYDINAVVCFDDKSKYENSKYLKNYFQNLDIHVAEIPWIPEVEGLGEKEEREKMFQYYKKRSLEEHTHSLARRIINQHVQRLKDMENMAKRTKKVIWHPFTQHKSIENTNDILVFDSAYGDYFQAKHTPKSIESVEQKADAPLLHPAFDGSASWWTQGLGHGNPELSLAAAYAAGRYGHIMFAGATHEPALTLAERLLEGLQNPRLTKAFYTDDGSTAVEVGIKMALRAACKRYEWDGSTEEIGVIGLKGSYHGDTIGAMDASEPCVYNKKVDWYRGRGYWFDFPTVKMREGRWAVEPPSGMEEDFGPAEYFAELGDIFNVETRAQSLRYGQYITRTLDKLVKSQGKKFGALVMEPIILGAGGMIFVDPLFQRTLVKVVRNYAFSSGTSNSVSDILTSDPNTWTGLPVLFDEVFTGLYRLGRFSAASFMQTHPDVSCHAKLLTGGLLPLSVTLASESIFSAFLGDSKSDALLHGHSYTAHPIGCHVANASLSKMARISRGSNWAEYRRSWLSPSPSFQQNNTSQFSILPPKENETGAWSMWSKRTVTSLSHHARVDSVIALGSVLAVTLKDSDGSGYTSNAAAGLRDALFNDAKEGQTSVHSRVLGNIIYFMASMTTSAEHLGAVEDAILDKLGR